MLESEMTELRKELKQSEKQGKELKRLSLELEERRRKRRKLGEMSKRFQSQAQAICEVPLKEQEAEEKPWTPMR